MSRKCHRQRKRHLPREFPGEHSVRPRVPARTPSTGAHGHLTLSHTSVPTPRPPPWLQAGVPHPGCRLVTSSVSWTRFSKDKNSNWAWTGAANQRDTRRLTRLSQAHWLCHRRANEHLTSQTSLALTRGSRLRLCGAWGTGKPDWWKRMSVGRQAGGAVLRRYEPRGGSKEMPCFQDAPTCTTAPDFPNPTWKNQHRPVTPVQKTPPDVCADGLRQKHRLRHRSARRLDRRGTLSRSTEAPRRRRDPHAAGRARQDAGRRLPAAPCLSVPLSSNHPSFRVRMGAHRSRAEARSQAPQRSGSASGCVPEFCAPGSPCAVPPPPQWEEARRGGKHPLCGSPCPPSSTIDRVQESSERESSRVLLGGLNSSGRHTLFTFEVAANGPDRMAHAQRGRRRRKAGAGGRGPPAAVCASDLRSGYAGLSGDPPPRKPLGCTDTVRAPVLVSP